MPQCQGLTQRKARCSKRALLGSHFCSCHQMMDQFGCGLELSKDVKELFAQMQILSTKLNTSKATYRNLKMHLEQNGRLTNAMEQLVTDLVNTRYEFKDVNQSNLINSPKTTEDVEKLRQFMKQYKEYVDKTSLLYDVASLVLETWNNKFKM